MRLRRHKGSSEHDEIDHRVALEKGPWACLILAPDDYTILSATDAYLRATMTRREDILGKTLFDVFPDDPADTSASGVRNLRASLERVRETLSSDVMAVQRYPVRRPADEGGQFEERFWSPINAPLIAPDGNLSCIIHRVEDVTEFVRHMEASGNEGASFERSYHRAALVIWHRQHYAKVLLQAGVGAALGLAVAAWLLQLSAASRLTQLP